MRRQPGIFIGIVVIIGIIFLFKEQGSHRNIGEANFTSQLPLGIKEEEQQKKSIPSAPATSISGSNGATVLKSALKSTHVKQGRYDLTQYNPAANPIAHQVDTVPSQNFQSHGQSYVLAQARAVPAENYDSSLGAVIEKKLGFVIFANAEEGAQGLSIQDNILRPVVMNPSTGRLGIVTGTIIVKYKDRKILSIISNNYSIKLLAVDDSISTAYFQVLSNQNIYEIVQAINQNQEVENVDFEIVQSVKKAN